MAGYTTVQAVIDALAKNACYRMLFSRVSGSSQTNGGRCTSWWAGAGDPEAGTYPSAGLGSAIALSKTSVGALNRGMPNAAAGAAWFALKFELAYTASGAPRAGECYTTFMFVDRLAHVSIAHNQPSGAISPALDGTARLASGEGAMILVEVASALSAGANTFNLTYTDQDGNSATTPNQTTTPSFPASQIPWNLDSRGLWIPFAAGDRGARTITNWTLVSGSATGTVCISLVKPILVVAGPLVYSVGKIDRDWITQLSGMQEVHDSACLSLIELCSTAVDGAPSQTVARVGELTLGHA